MTGLGMTVVTLLVVLMMASSSWAALGPLRSACLGDRHLPTLRCDLAVVGGGPGGAHLAFQYAKRYGRTKKVCVFERSTPEFGCGRFRDVLQPEGSRVPMGGMRWHQTGNRTHRLYNLLADEFGIVRYPDRLTDEVKSPHQYVRVRGLSNLADGQLTSEQLARYSLNQLPPDQDPVDYMYDTMVSIYRSRPEEAATNASMAAWARYLFGDEGLWLLRDTDRYRSDFLDANDVPSFMEGFLWDSQFDGPRYYPDGGMSSFCRGMFARVEAEGGEVYYGPDAEVQSADFLNSQYQLRTKKYRILADSLALAIPGLDLQRLKGNVIARLTDTKFVKAFLPDPVVIVGQAWSEEWWLQGSPFKTGQAISQDGFNSYAHIFTESTPYGRNQNLTRSVFCDDPMAIRQWQAIYDQQGIDGVSRMAVEGLKLMYPGVTNIPAPKKTLYEYYENGWSWLKSGAYQQGITTLTLEEWAKDPLPDFVPNCSLVLPTDSWAVGQAAWVAGAWGIAVDWMNRCHGTALENSYDYCLPDFPKNQTWCDCDGSPGQIIPPEGRAYRMVHCPMPLHSPAPPDYGPRDE